MAIEVGLSSMCPCWNGVEAATFAASSRSHKLEETIQGKTMYLKMDAVKYTRGKVTQTTYKESKNPTKDAKKMSGCDGSTLSLASSLLLHGIFVWMGG